MNTIKLERGTDKLAAVATLTFNRPDKLNALNDELLGETEAALRDLYNDHSLKVLVLTGAGDKAFVAGADILTMSKLSSGEAHTFGARGHRVGRMLEEAPFAVIGAINGFALGGGLEIAMCSDFLYASDKAKFGQPEINLGVIPGMGGTQRLTRRVGIGMARELCLTGKMIDAQEALRITLVNAVFPHAELLPRVYETAATIASKSQLPIRAVRRTITFGADVPLATANELELQAFSALFGSDDQREGMGAFLEKRAAAFTGK
jgi:enoyl-CoA hydratase